ncbi:MAG: hypothetical protein M1831_003291 [Alyxoria varia]|nr:MAG: hypothetical protein M1831_003291 [Alyxoria varia]
MPSLLLVVFVLQLAIHILNSVGATAVNELAWILYNKLPTPTSFAARTASSLRKEVLRLKQELNGVSAQDEFSKWAKLRRQHDKATADYEKCYKMRFTEFISTFGVSIAFFLVRNGPGWYRYLRSSTKREKPATRPTPPGVSRALNILFAVAIVAFLSTFKHPPNVFRETESRLQTNNDLIFHRVVAKRDLTPLEEALKPKLISKEGRLLYLIYGPYVVAECSFCQSGEPWTYLLYAAPSILLPHVFNLAIIGLVTSRFFTGPEGARWRVKFATAGVMLGAAEMLAIWSFDNVANIKSQHMSEMNHFHWHMIFYRGCALAILDALLGWVLWLSSTNRYFVKPLTPAQRLDGVIKLATITRARLNATEAMHDLVMSDEANQDDVCQYWTSEEELFEEPEVKNAMRNARKRAEGVDLRDSSERNSRNLMRLIMPQSPRESAES